MYMYLPGPSMGLGVPRGGGMFYWDRLVWVCLAVELCRAGGSVASRGLKVRYLTLIYSTCD